MVCRRDREKVPGPVRGPSAVAQDRRVRAGAPGHGAPRARRAERAPRAASRLGGWYGPAHASHQEVLAAVSVAAVPSAAWASIAEVDPELWAAMEAERHRQTDKIELIASENYVYQAVNEAQGSWLTNKYAEGLPGKRYYGGCEYVDIAENLARERALRAVPGRRPRQCPAALGRPGEHGRLLRGAQARRPDPGHEPGPRRPPDARQPGQLLRPHVRGPRVRRDPGDRDHRLRRARGAGEGRPAEGDRRRGERLPAHVGLRADGGHRPRRRSAAVRGHGPLRGPRRGGPPPEPVPARGPRHDDHPQDPSRAPWRPDVLARGPPRRHRSRGLPGPWQEHPRAGRSTRASSRASRAAR